jgi:hypothetical protein
MLSCKESEDWAYNSVNVKQAELKLNPFTLYFDYSNLTWKLCSWKMQHFTKTRIYKEKTKVRLTGWYYQHKIIHENYWKINTQTYILSLFFSSTFTFTWIHQTNLELDDSVSQKAVYASFYINNIYVTSLSYKSPFQKQYNLWVYNYWLMSAPVNRQSQLFNLSSLCIKKFSLNRWWTWLWYPFLSDKTYFGAWDFIKCSLPKMGGVSD